MSKIKESVNRVSENYGDSFITSISITMSAGMHRVVLDGHVSHYPINASSEDRHMPIALSDSISKFERQVRKRKTKLNRKNRIK